MASTQWTFKGVNRIASQPTTTTNTVIPTISYGFSGIQIGKKVEQKT
jgi:hypothetical protein